jgi:hypothetical protein
MSSAGKDCPKCAQTLPLFSFYKDVSKKDGLTSYCKACSKDKRLKTYHDNAEVEKEKLTTYYNKNKDRAKHYRLSKVYGLDKEEYERMYDEQQGKCAICGTHHDELKRGLFVDHCHSTEQVRGLLCQFCNTLLGMAQDNPSVLLNAVNYLKKY